MRMQVGGIILCGGQSTRMGTSKALLPFGAETMLGRVVRLLGEAVSPIVVVAAESQHLPPLPASVLLACDEQEARGPLEGLRAGLKALPEGVEAAFVTSCDVPLLVPAFVVRMIALLGSYELCVPVADGFEHPLAAIYRRSVLAQVEQHLATGRMRMMDLLDTVPTRRVLTEEFADVDPDGNSLRNLNRPEDYRAALQAAGL